MFFGEKPGEFPEILSMLMEARDARIRRTLTECAKDDVKEAGPFEEWYQCREMPAWNRAVGCIPPERIEMRLENGIQNAFFTRGPSAVTLPKARHFSLRLQYRQRLRRPPLPSKYTEFCTSRRSS